MHTKLENSETGVAPACIGNQSKDLELSPQRSEITSAAPHRYKYLKLVLIRPSKYDDEGYVIRYWKGVLPSNTLACLYGLTEDVRERQVLGENLEWHIDLIDETVERVRVEKIIRNSRRVDTKTVVGLVGVQSNQFARASDLAFMFREAGIEVLIGGFHVSGVLATLPDLTPELKALVQAGVTLVAGEVEGRWEKILLDMIHDRLQPIYNFLGDPPDLSNAPVPKIGKKLLNKYAVKHFATLDCGRGCPFGCTFCTVINVQGRKMRYRSVDSIINLLRKNHREHNISHYFFTDDNFCRNKNWEEIFDAMIRLRKEEKIRLSFMMQVDTESYRIPNFISKAARAGCTQVFIGMESVNPENLKSTGKTQNRTQHFSELVQAYQRVGIAVHLAYIIGFPFDDELSVPKDIEFLSKDLIADQASFFMLTPLPGSVDYRNMLDQGRMMDADLNNFDSFHETYQHVRLKNGSWKRAYDNAWKNYYGVENMKYILDHVHFRKYWGVFLNFIWYKNAVQVEGGHPMVHGFFRVKSRRERRPLYGIENRRQFFKRRLRDFASGIRGWLRLILDMEEVWLATRSRTPLEQRVVWEMAQIQKRAREWRSLRLSELQSFYQKAASNLEMARKNSGISKINIKIPSRFQLWLRQRNIFSDSLTFTRSPMKHFWGDAIDKLKHGRVYRIDYLRMFHTVIRELSLFYQFIRSLVKRLKRASSSVA